MNESTTERAAIIRAALKAKGWTGRDVSVRADYYSMGSSIDIRIKNPAVPSAIVKKIAEEHERIHRCEITGEILGGGNRYVSVTYTSEALAALAKPYAERVRQILTERPISDTSLYAIEGTPFLLGHSDEHRATLWHKDSGHLGQYWPGAVEEIAASIAVRMHNAGIL